MDSQSAQPCGCDAGADHKCGLHTWTDWKQTPHTPEHFVVKDSGNRQQFASGSLRDTTEGKIDYSRALDGPMFERLAIHLTKAESKYPDVRPGFQNWMLISTEEELVRYRKSAVRHFIQWLRGDTDEDHAAAVFFNINGVEYIKEQMKP